MILFWLGEELMDNQTKEKDMTKNGIEKSTSGWADNVTHSIIECPVDHSYYDMPLFYPFLFLLLFTVLTVILMTTASLTRTR